MTSMRSSSCSVVSAAGISVSPFRQRRLTTKGMWLCAATSWSVFPQMAGFLTWNEKTVACFFGSFSTLWSCATSHRFISAMTMMTPTVPMGYVTAHASAATASGWRRSCSVCCAAPRAGVLVVAPQSTPMASAMGIHPMRMTPRVIAVPSTRMAMPSALSTPPPLRNALKNPGPTCMPRA